jgi:hypothetical protein
MFAILSYWLELVTPVYAATAGPLIDGTDAVRGGRADGRHQPVSQPPLLDHPAVGQFRSQSQRSQLCSS